jgi:hypothetical protein
MWPFRKREWVDSSLSMYNGNCVVVWGLNGRSRYVELRDSKNLRQRGIRFTHQEWDEFVADIQAGRVMSWDECKSRLRQEA